MNEYIINPNVFYWVSVINTFHYIFWILGILSFIIGGVVLSDEDYNKKTTVIWVASVIIFILIGILLPSREVMYQMLASKIVTKDVAVKGLDYINNIVGQLLTR